MKKLTLIFLLVLFSLISTFGQEFKRPSEGKSLVYFVRFSGVGALINFRYFDGNQSLGKANGVNYIEYECDPGEHLFWASAENRDFIKGNLKANATYVVEVRPTMGATRARVKLFPVAPTDDKALKKIKKLIAKKPPTELKKDDEDMAIFIKNGLQRYEKTQDKIQMINSNWTH